MENVNEKELSFPQRHWLILCILVAIVSPLLVNSMQTLAAKKRYNEAIHQTPVKGGGEGTSPSGGAVAPGDTAGSGSVTPLAPASVNQVKDTSYKVAAPPQTK